MEIVSAYIHVLYISVHLFGMETNQSNIFVQPLEIPKVVDSVEYVAV